MLGIIVVLILALVGVGTVVFKLNDKIDTLETNQRQFLGDSLNKKISLAKDEFRLALQPQLDSIEKHSGVKNKYVTNVTEIHQHYHSYDTTIIQAPEIGPNLFDISFGTKCWGYKGTFNTNTNQVLLSNKWASSNVTIFGYTQRDNLFGKKKGNPWGPKWGTKRSFLGSYSDCSDSTKVTEYVLDKKQ